MARGGNGSAPDSFLKSSTTSRLRGSSRIALSCFSGSNGDTSKPESLPCGVRPSQRNSVTCRSVPLLAQLVDERGVEKTLGFELADGGISFSFDVENKLDRGAVGDEGLAQPRQDNFPMVFAQKRRVVDLGISCQDFQRRIFVGKHEPYGIEVGFDDALDDGGALANISPCRRQTRQREQQFVGVIQQLPAPEKCRYHAVSNDADPEALAALTADEPNP